MGGGSSPFFLYSFHVVFSDKINLHSHLQQIDKYDPRMCIPLSRRVKSFRNLLKSFFLLKISVISLEN